MSDIVKIEMQMDVVEWMELKAARSFERGSEFQKRLNEAATTIATLRRALEPFAHEAGWVGAEWDDHRMLRSFLDCSLTVGNLREARAALQGNSTEKENP